LKAGALARAHSAAYPWDVAKLMAAQGLLASPCPRPTAARRHADGRVIAIETVASVCPRSADVVQAGSFGPVRVLAEYGTPLQRSATSSASSQEKP